MPLTKQTVLNSEGKHGTEESKMEEADYLCNTIQFYVGVYTALQKRHGVQLLRHTIMSLEETVFIYCPISNKVLVKLCETV